MPTTQDQRMRSLDRANEIRMQRARLKAAIKTHQVSPLEILVRPPGFATKMTVLELLRAIPQSGPVSLGEHNLPLGKRIGALTERDVRDINVQLTKHEWWKRAKRNGAISS